MTDQGFMPDISRQVRKALSRAARCSRVVTELEVVADPERV